MRPLLLSNTSNNDAPLSNISRDNEPLSKFQMISLACQNAPMVSHVLKAPRRSWRNPGDFSCHSEPLWLHCRGMIEGTTSSHNEELYFVSSPFVHMFFFKVSSAVWIYCGSYNNFRAEMFFDAINFERYVRCMISILAFRSLFAICINVVKHYQRIIHDIKYQLKLKTSFSCCSYFHFECNLSE